MVAGRAQAENENKKRNVSPRNRLRQGRQVERAQDQTITPLTPPLCVRPHHTQEQCSSVAQTAGGVQARPPPRSMGTRRARRLLVFTALSVDGKLGPRDRP